MKEEIIKLRKEGKSYRDIQKELGCSKSTISFHCVKLNLNTPVEYTPVIKTGEYVKNKNQRSCINCGIDISDKPYRQKTCSISCGSKNKNKNSYLKFIENWKLGINSGGKGDLGGHGVVSNHVRKYLFLKYDNKCSMCGWSEINPYTGTIPLEVEHIDGNPMNHVENNLTLLCPNCHSLTAGHSTSKGSGRRYYREKYLKNGTENLLD